MCILLNSLFDLSFVAFPSVLRYCWLGLLTCKNRLPYNLYCVGGDVKHCTIQSNASDTLTRSLHVINLLLTCDLHLVQFCLIGIRCYVIYTFDMPRAHNISTTHYVVH